MATFARCSKCGERGVNSMTQPAYTGMQPTMLDYRHPECDPAPWSRLLDHLLPPGRKSDS